MSRDIVVAEDNSAPTTPNILDPVDIDAVVNFFDNYQELTNQLLDKSDYQSMGKDKEGNPRKFKKKSAFRKYSTAFNLSDRIIEKEIIRDDEQHIISARYEVQVIAPNGRSVVGTGASSIFDKITSKDNVMPSDFELRKRFSNAEHDILSTAHTRAKNRAISDLIGAGDVSFEEMEGMEFEDNKPKRKNNNDDDSSNESVQDKSSTPKRSKKTGQELENDGVLDDDSNIIEAEIVRNDENSTPYKAIMELTEKNNAIRKAVNKLKDEDSHITKSIVADKLITIMEAGIITTDEYYEAKELLNF